jgi:hypothetical protein
MDGRTIDAESWLLSMVLYSITLWKGAPLMLKVGYYP